MVLASVLLKDEIGRPAPTRLAAEIEPRKTDVIPETLPTESFERVVRTVLVADVVESVRLMQEDEAGTVQRWRSFVDHVVHRLLPGHEGRLVKSLGDGLMLEFPRVATAVGIANGRSTMASTTRRPGNG